MKFFVREILDATPRSRVASQGGSRRETGRNDLDAATGDPQSNLRFTRTAPTRLHDMSGASSNILPRRISHGRLAFIRRRQSDDTIPFAIRPTKRAAFAVLSKCDKRRQRICRHLLQCDKAYRWW